MEGKGGLAGEDLAEDVGEDAAVKVVFHFDGGIEAAEDRSFLGDPIFSLDDEGELLLGFGRLA